MLNIARTIDLLALAFVFGTTLWFFFIQSPVLVKKMGRDKFVPLQMRLTVVLFKSLCVALLVMLGATLVQGDSAQGWPLVTATLALVAAVINNFVVLPRALRAGGQSMKEERSAQEQRSVAKFASEGGGKPAQFWHRTVVLFVVAMLASVVPHGISLVSL